MSSRHRASEEDEILAQINVIPLVDVSLVLLIIFIVTASHILTPSIRINLPQSTRASGMSGMETIDIVISNEGIIYLEDEIVTMKELEEQVAALHQKDPEGTVVISVDKATYFQRVIDALDLLSGLGIARLDIRTVKGN